MRINGPHNSEIHKASAAERKKSASDAGEAGKSQRGGREAVVVELGDTARTMAAEKGPGLEPAMKARLEEVREQLRNGEYAIDYRRLASSLLDDEVARAGGE